MRKPRLLGFLPRAPGGPPRHSAENFDEKFIAEGGPFHGLYGSSLHCWQ